MDQYFARALLMEEGELMLVALALIIVGGVAASFIARPVHRYSRIKYIWALAGLNLALSISQFGWLFSPAAASADALWLLIVGMALCFLVFGAVTYYTSAARSNDMIGTTSKAWMGFIPIVNLWLIFSRGEERADEDKPSAARRFVVNPLLVTGALVVFALGQGFGKVLEETPAPTGNSDLAALMASAQTLEESFANEARLSSSELPKRLDSITVMRSITAEGRELHVNMDVEQEISGFQPGFKASIAAEQCSPAMFGHDLRRGGAIVYNYYGPTGGMIDRFYITQADC